MIAPVYILYTEDKATVSERTILFERCMEPLLSRLEAAVNAKRVPEDITEFRDYVQVCRWPFRKLEYAFALNALLARLQPGDRYLDAGCGVTPLAYVIAAMGVEAYACDSDERLVKALETIDTPSIYGVTITCERRDLTMTTYPDGWFDAISCISVIEHIQAPDDQRALKELIRLLRPGGVLIATIDFAPGSLGHLSRSRARHYANRIRSIPLRRMPTEVSRGVRRKIRARQSISQGRARHARTANQRFERMHLEHDILPLLSEGLIPDALGFTAGLDIANADDARRFWDLEPNLFALQSSRAVLPVGFIYQKSGNPHDPLQ